MPHRDKIMRERLFHHLERALIREYGGVGQRIVNEAKEAEGESPLMLFQLVAHSLGEAGLHLAEEVAADLMLDSAFDLKGRYEVDVNDARSLAKVLDYAHPRGNGKVVESSPHKFVKRERCCPVCEITKAKTDGHYPEECARVLGAVEEVIVKSLNPEAKYATVVVGHDQGEAWREIAVEVP